MQSVTTSQTNAAPLNTLPPLTSDYGLSSEQIAAFQRDGHILLRDVAGRDELPPYRGAINDVVRKKSPQLKKLEDRDTSAG